MLAMRSSAVGIAAVAMVNAAAANTNMNGEYTIANPGLKAFARTSNMSHYAGGGSPVEYFDVYSPPIRSRYGQTFWTMMDAVPLPKEIVERFDGKTMAITGVRSLQGCAALSTSQLSNEAALLRSTSRTRCSSRSRASPTSPCPSPGRTTTTLSII